MHSGQLQMHSRKLYCIARSFIAQQKVLLHSRKVSLTAETKEKSVLWQILEKSQSRGKNWRKVLFMAETEDKPTLQHLPLDLYSMFAQNLAVAKWYFGAHSVNCQAQLPSQKKKCKMNPRHFLATPLGSWDQDGENEIFLPHKHVSKSLPKQDMQMFLNLPRYILRKVSKMSQQSYSRILWWNITATLQQNNVVEFYGRILLQRYSKTVSQQNSVAECSSVIVGQYRSRILWQNIATLQQDSTVAEFCGKTQQCQNRAVS